MKENIKDYSLLLIVILLFYVISNFFYGYFKLGDDTYIYLQYATNIIHHAEISFNLGEKSYGFTSPLWLFLIAGLNYFIHNLISIPEILSLSFSILTIIVWFFIIKELEPNKTILFLLLLFISLDPNLLKHSHLGMEASLSYFLSSLLILLFLNYKNKPMPYTLGLALGVYSLVRPESFILAIICIFWLLVNSFLRIKDILKIISSAIIVTLPWNIFSYFYFGNIVSSTSYAKGLAFPLGRIFFHQLITSFEIIAGNYIAVIIVLIAVFFSKETRKKLLYKAGFYFYLTLILFFTFIILYSLVLNNELVYARYYTMLFPFLMLLVVLLISKCITSYKNKIIIISVILLSFISLTGLYSNINRKLYLSNESLENKVVRWVNLNTSNNSKIVRSRIGKIGFLTDRIIIDPVGLINPEVIKYNLKDSTAEYFKEMKIDYLIESNSWWSDEMKKYADLKLVKSFPPGYDNLVRNYFSRQNKLGFLNIYKVEWSHDKAE